MNKNAIERNTLILLILAFTIAVVMFFVYKSGAANLNWGRLFGI